MIENFKAWPEADLEFGQLTGLFGTNSSGKTSLLQFLLMLKQTKDTADRGLTLELGGPHVTLVGYSDFIYNHDDSNGLTWSLTREQVDDLILIDPAGKRTDAFARGRVVAIDSSIDAVRGAGGWLRSIARTPRADPAVLCGRRVDSDLGAARNSSASAGPSRACRRHLEGLSASKPASDC
jgi:hypothetical protein